MVLHSFYYLERSEHGEKETALCFWDADMFVVHFRQHVYWQVAFFELIDPCTNFSFLGIVVENFSYIYQQRRNQTLNREEMRAFKKVWAQFDQSSTGYLDRNKIVPFLAVGPCPLSFPPDTHVFFSETDWRFRSPNLPGHLPIPHPVRRIESAPLRPVRSWHESRSSGPAKAPREPGGSESRRRA